MAFRYAWRTLRRSPLYFTVALVSLSLGLGFSGAVFIFAWPVLYRDLPVSHATELLVVSATTAGDRFSYPLFLDLRDRTPVFAALAARCAVPVDFRENDRTRRIHAEVVSGTWFNTLGLGVALGRGLTPDDDRVPGGHSVAVLTYDFWRTQFRGDPGVLRRVILLNGHPMTVVGVAARGYRGFDLGERTDVLVTTMMQAAMIPAWYGLEDRSRPWLQLAGRLRPGITVEQAEARLDPFYRTLSGLDRRTPGVVSEGGAIALEAAPQGVSELRGRLAPRLRRLCWWAALVWLCVCANYAALLLARSAARQREVAIRVVLGATRRRALRHFAAEGAILATAATGLGLLVASWIGGGTLDLFANAGATGLSARIDLATVVFTLAVALGSTAMLAGVPALGASATPLSQLLNQRPENAPAAARGTEWLKVVVAAELAVSLALVWHAAVLGSHLRKLSREEIGVQRRGLASFSVDPALEAFSAERVRRFAEGLREKLLATPGIVAAAAANLPLTGEAEAEAVRIAGYPGSTPQVRLVGPGYFATLGVRMVAGHELAGDCGEAVANEAWMEGKVFQPAETEGRRLVGVAANVRSRPDAPAQPTVYLPLCGDGWGSGFTMYFRAAGDSRGSYGAIYRTVAEMNAALPVTEMRSMGDEVREAIAPERAAFAISAVLAAIVMVLGGFGIYTVAVGVASRRRREFRIRLALGASRHGLRHAIAREVVVVAAVGAVVGIGLALVTGAPV